MNRQDPMVMTLEIKLKCLELRKTGMGYEKIAAAVGLNNRIQAFRAVKGALKYTLKEPTDAVRALELERIDAMLAAIWVQVTNGNLGAIDRALKMIETRAKLLGLNAVQKVEFSFEKMTDDQLAKYIEKTITEIGAINAGSKEEKSQDTTITIE
jgi:hypothetical protein